MHYVDCQSQVCVSRFVIRSSRCLICRIILTASERMTPQVSQTTGVDTVSSVGMSAATNEDHDRLQSSPMLLPCAWRVGVTAHLLVQVHQYTTAKATDTRPYRYLKITQ